VRPEKPPLATDDGRRRIAVERLRSAKLTWLVPVLGVTGHDGKEEDMAIVRKASATVFAGFAILAASAVLALSRVATLDDDLRGTASSWLGVVSAAPAGESDTSRARLGRALFWDVRISANGQVARASCHTRKN